MRIEAITADLHRSVAQVTWLSDVGSVTAGHRHRLRVPVPGEHNIQNAAAALVAAVAGYAVDVDQGVRALDDFAGTRRRFELVGHAGGVEVVDDYAHNGPKVAAVVRAGRAVAGDGRRLVVVFQPHMYSRTAAFAADFADGLSPADVVVVLDVYGARESPVPGVSGETVVSALRARGGRTPELHYVAARDEAVDRISALLRAGDLVLTVGAGDVTSVGPELLRRRGHERG
jgi:UDP-N-acetylmuramate--alanine ligase